MLRNVAGQAVKFSLFKAGARIANPTIAAADFKRDLDGAGQGNVTTDPTSDAAGLVTWLPSQAETDARYVTLLGLDVLGDQWEPLTIVFDTLMDTSVATVLAGATLAATQPAITWAQQKIVANVNGEGALDITNTNAAGYGQHNTGGANSWGLYNYAGVAGQMNWGGNTGTYNLGGTDFGVYNLGGADGLRSDGTAGYGIRAIGGTEPVNWLGDIADEVWAEALPGAYVAGSAGYILGNWAGVTVTLASPIVDDDEITIYQADDYYDADERDLEWTETGTTWPNITAATVTCYFRSPADDKMNVAGSVVVGGGGPGQKIRVELSAVQTATLASWPSPTQFKVRLTLAGGHKVTLVAGRVTVVHDIA